MERINAYRRDGRLSLERQDPDDEEVEVELLPGTRLERSAFGELRFYHRHQPFGQTLHTAIQLGWCRLLDAAAEDEDSADSSSCSSGA
ncbi:MAG: hypothetical protein K0Q72_5330 [Armatimonadetes bacterium]|jgi:hypothetical protein|nr:hypothetical protein [Armatimonadota bacterium]